MLSQKLSSAVKLLENSIPIQVTHQKLFNTNETVNNPFKSIFKFVGDI